MRRWFVALSVIAVPVILARLSLPVVAAPLRQCGNACGIPGCQTCRVESGFAECTSWCDSEDPPSPPPLPQPTPTTPPTDPPPVETPPPGVTPTPEEGTVMTCYTCAPWPYCSSGYAEVCTVTDYNFSPPFQWVHSWRCMGEAACAQPTPEPEETPTPPAPCISHPPDVICEGDVWDSYLWVSARVPPHLVQVSPFPRWLVAMGAPLPEPYESGSPGMLTLQDYPTFTPPGLCAPNGPGDSEGCWSDGVAIPQRDADEEPEPGDIRDYRIGLRWRRVRNDRPESNDLGAVPPVCWDFDEREWNVGADYGYGRIPAMECGATSVTHVYETSSWGKPHNGPRFIPPDEACSSWTSACERRREPPPSGMWDPCHCCEQVPSEEGEWNMPAYQVKVYTTWSAEWAVRWDAWEVVGTEWSPEDGCFSRPEGEPLGISHRDCPYADNRGCNPADPWCGQVGEPTYDWVHHFEGWHPIDLRDFGSSTWYYTSFAVITTGAGPWCEWEYADPNPGDTVRVPVIEVQSVLRDPCVIDDSCPPGYP